MDVLGAILDTATPESLKRLAEKIEPYQKPKPKKSELPETLSTGEFQQELKRKFGIVKRRDWIRNDLFAQCQALKDYAYGLGGGYGSSIRIDKKAIDWIDKHFQLIDWKG